MSRGQAGEPISHTEIISYGQGHGLLPPPVWVTKAPGYDRDDYPEHLMESWDITVIRLLDAIWWKVQDSVEPPPKPEPQQPQHGAAMAPVGPGRIRR